MLPLTRSRNRARFFGTPFSPEALFAGGTVAGAWYDPSDLTTMFTTSAGTTQCAMPGQGSAVSVGAMLDKRATGYSVFCAGAGERYSVPASSAFSYGTGAFTVEAWIYATAINDGFVYSQTASGQNYFGLVVGPTGTVFFIFGSGGGTSISSPASTIATNTWYHVAVVREGTGTNQTKLYVNGVQQAVGTCSFDFTNTTYNPTVGGYTHTTTNSFSGYISNLRVVKGAAVYTGAFTPSGPLAAISGTSLLTAGIVWSGNPTITNAGARVDGLNPFTASPTGNHAIAFNDTTARPELRARVNLLTYSEDQSNGAWINYSATQQSNVGTAPDGTNTADRIVEASGSSLQARYQTLAGGLGISHTVSAYAKADQRNVFNLSYSGVGGTNWFAATFELTGNGSVTKTGAGAAGTYTSSSIIPVGNGWYFCTVTGNPGQASTHYAYGGPSDTNNPTYGNFGVLTYSGNTANGVLVWGFDVRPANIGANVPAYQAVVDANTYDTSGFPLYLRFDGIDDSMYTPANLNLSGTDKVSVFAGVRKFNNTTQQFIVETSTNASINNGSFALLTNTNSGGGLALSAYGGLFRGTSNAGYGAAGTTAPISNVVTLLGNIAAATDAVIMRVNGAQVATSGATSAGAGNFGSYPTYIASRQGVAPNLLEGHLHSLIIAGSAVSASNISATEQWVAQRTGIVIP